MLKFLLLMIVQSCVLRSNIGNITLNKNLDNELCIAAEKGDEKKVKALLKKGFDIYQRYTVKFNGEVDGSTPMTAASRKGRVEVMKLLLKAGVDPNKEDYAESTPLGEAILHKQMGVVKFLLKEKVDVNKASGGHSPLAWAGRCDFGMMPDLLAAGADVNSRVGPYGSTPLLSFLFLCCQEDKKVLEFLLENGADPNLVSADGCPPLLEAVRLNRPHIVQVLLEAGANPNGGESLFYTPLYAIRKMHNFSDQERQDKIQQMLLDSGAIFEKVGSDGVLPIYKLAKMVDIPHGVTGHGLTEAVEVVLDNCSSFDDQDQDGKTPLYYAGESLNWIVIRYLLERGASLRKAMDAGLDFTKIKQDGQALIHIIAANGKGSQLCNIGLDSSQINTLNRRGDNILHCSLYSYQSYMSSKNDIEMMVNAGCMLLKENKSGKLPIEIAVKNNKSGPEYLEIVKFLYHKMKENRACAPLMLKAEVSMEKYGARKVKEFLAAEKQRTIKSSGKRKVDDVGGGPAQKKQVVIKDKKRKADDDDIGQDNGKKTKVSVKTMKQTTKSKKRKTDGSGNPKLKK